MAILRRGDRADFPSRCSHTVPRLAMILLGFVATAQPRAKAEPPGTNPLIGYTEFRTDLPGGRHANVATMRAAVVGDGRHRPAAHRRGA